jgi:hypothetical protein
MPSGFDSRPMKKIISMKTISLIFKRSLFVRTTTLVVCFLLASLLASSQSETHDFITYDTSIVVGSGSGTVRWTMRISRPANMFTANHPDNAPRPLILTMPGQGEVGTNPAYLSRYGPHYWMNNGWDGSVVLGNGKHYPIIITVISSVVNPRAPVVLPMVQHILNTYRIKRNSVHLAGLSMGGFTWGKLIVYAAYAGDETAMSLVTSLTALQGVSSEVFAPYNAWTMPGWTAYGKWAEKYNGKFFGLEGTSDTRDVWRPRDAMEAKRPGSAFFSFENYGSGGHCCWNSMYDPKVTDWTSSNPNVANNTYHPNSSGTYKKGSSIFQWMLRQGDTSMVGSAVVIPPNNPPVVDAGTAPAINLPVSNVQLNGTATDADGSITTYAWSKTAGPAQFAFSNTAVANPVVSNLIEGTYTFRLTVTDNRGASVSDNVNVVVNPPVVIPVVSAQVNVNLYGGTNAYSNTQWNNWNVSGSTTNLTSPAFKYTDGTTSTIKAILSQSTGVGDNSSTYPGGMVAAEVLRYASYSTMSRNLTITGLAASQQYSIELYGSRKGVTNNKTVYSIGSTKDTVLTDNNASDKSVFTATADNTGKIVVAINRTNVYTYLNGFTIKALAAAGATRMATIDAAVEQVNTQSFNVFPNPFQDRLVLQVNNDKVGTMKVQIIDMKGTVNREFSLSKNQAGSMQTYLSAGNLASGEYILRVTIGNWSESRKITKL